jgi:hypothetical protein
MLSSHSASRLIHSCLFVNLQIANHKCQITIKLKKKIKNQRKQPTNQTNNITQKKKIQTNNKQINKILNNKLINKRI